MRVLWFNWRDIRNPDAGGAEVFTYEVMRKLAKRGHEMTLFTTRFSDAPKYEKMEDVNIIRGGGKYTVYIKARHYYRKQKHKYDLVIDEINTRPFLTPNFVKEKPILALFHQLARNFWFYETPFPLNYLGYYYLERKWLSHYKDIPTITVSNSSRDDLQAIGFKKILIVPEGLNVNPLSEVRQKGSVPIIVFLGRLRKAKLPHHALQAFYQVKKELKDAKMWVIGDGYMREELEKFNIKDVIFYGRIKNEFKYELLSKAHLVLVPSIREGWGLVVTEANAMGTPVIAYNVPGLKDSVRDGETGILVRENSPHALARSAVYLLKNRDILNKLSSNALAFSRQFSWNNTAEIFDNIIKNYSKYLPY